MAWGGSFFQLPPHTFSHGGEVKNFPPRHFPMGGKFAPKFFGACGGLESYYVVFSVLEPSIAHLLVTSPPQAENFGICGLFSLRKCGFLKENRHLDVSDCQNFPPAAGHPNPTSPPWWGEVSKTSPPASGPWGGKLPPPASLPWGGSFSENQTSPPPWGGITIPGLG